VGSRILRDTFEPSKYLASLIAAVNEGAKSAQTGLLAFSLLGLYLLVTAFSTSDEDLLLEHTVLVSQIGVQVPVVFSFAIAPLVFLLLHGYTLIRFHMLAANLRQFLADLEVSVLLEADRERCRHLLANVEFVQAHTAPPNSALGSLLYRGIAWLMLAGFPVAILIAVQISFLRYQSEVITRFQSFYVALAVGLLVWFFRRGRWAKASGNALWYSWAYWLKLCIPAAVVVVLDCEYLNVPSADASTVHSEPGRSVQWREAYKQPLDLVLCPALRWGWGCRFLTIKSRTLVGHVWNPQAIADLRIGQQVDTKKSLAQVEGIILRDRTLRFANFSESRFYAADMMGADLRKAWLYRTQLTGASLADANLAGAHLNEANLSAADLSAVFFLLIATQPSAPAMPAGAANLAGADLAGANLTGASIAGADLSGANLVRANLTGARLDWTNVSKANLTSAKIVQSQLDDACGDAGTKVSNPLTVHVCNPPEPVIIPLH
jgi:uncharacterized protein YjbI with pentapeptide repeats